jgi:hypothetical protein
VQQLEIRHCEHVREIELLSQTYQMLLELQEARSRACDNQVVGTAIIEDNFSQQVQLQETLRLWTIADPWLPSEQWDTTWINHNAWGVGIMQSVMSWLRTCTWPQDENINKDDIGISWTEIAIAIMLHHGQVLPLKRLKGDVQYVIQPKTEMEIQLAGTTMSEQSRNAYAIVQHCWSFIPQQMLPQHVEMGKTKSLYYQGHSEFTTGLRRRPSFDKQKEVNEILKQFLPTTNRRLEGMPHFSFPPFNEHQVDADQKDVPWKERDKRARKALLMVRKCRE